MVWTSPYWMRAPSLTASPSRNPSNPAGLPVLLPGNEPLIGRDHELTELRRMLYEALAGHGSLVLIGGEAGVGKSHLARAVLEEAKSQGALGIVGHCYEMEGAPPYVPFIEILEYITRMAPREGLRHSLDRKSTRLNSSHLGISY